jgi:hypothetical protein
MSDLINPYAEWIFMMIGVGAALPANEFAALLEWEKMNVGGEVGTSDWPGWAKYIGPKPRVPLSLPERKTAIPSSLRLQVFERDNFACRGCGSRRELCADHIVPSSKGGPTEVSNLQTLCRRCNSAKGAR